MAKRQAVNERQRTYPRLLETHPAPVPAIASPDTGNQMPAALWDVGLDSAMGLDLGGLPMAGTVFPHDRSQYWAKRRNDRIYLMTIVLAHFLCRRKVTIADVGCHVSPLVLMMPDFTKRFAIDPSREAREAWEGVDGATFLNSLLDDVDVKALTGEDRFDLIMCHQVIEHLPDPAGLIALLHARARRVILSTTYETPAGMMPGHIQDPISLKKLESWLPSKAICTLISPGREGGKVLTVF